MQTCRNCFRHIDDDIAYCPYCGNRVYVTPVPPVPVAEHPAPPRKPISKKKLAIIIIACILLVAQSIGIVVCETRIYQAKQLYAQGEYYKAYSLVRLIPPLGREKVIRIKTARWAADSYESHLSRKRKHMDKDGRMDEYDYQNSLFDLIFQLYLNKRALETYDLNRIEQDEYEKFTKLIYKELREVFYISEAEADLLVYAFQEASVDQMYDIANNWLEENFY